MNYQNEQAMSFLNDLIFPDTPDNLVFMFVGRDYARSCFKTTKLPNSVIPRTAR